MPKPLLLIVDDEDDIRSLLSEIFKSKFRVLTGATIAEGKRRLKNQKVDLLFLDLNLPDGSGFEIISSFKDEMDSNCVIIISAHKGSVQMSKAEQCGITHFFEKPIDIDKLKSTVNNIILT